VLFVLVFSTIYVSWQRLQTLGCNAKMYFILKSICE